MKVALGREALSAVVGRTLVWVSKNDGDTWLDESGDYTALSGGIAQWYGRTLYICSLGQGISAKVFDEDDDGQREMLALDVAVV